MELNGKSDIIVVGGVHLPQPTTYDLKFIDVDSSNSGRNDGGFMMRDRVRHDVCSISVGWTLLSNSELEAIRTAIEREEFTVRYYDGQYNTTKMYAGDRQVTLVAMPDGDARWNMSVSLIAL